MITLYSDPKDCCACGACLNVCPKQAITMRPDSYGFDYPYIDVNKCIECQACLKVCNYQNGSLENNPLKVYAAASKNEELIMQSASGGIFSTIAQYIINNEGIVFGASLFRNGNKFEIKHIGVSHLNDLPILLGSKYVQSNIENSYKEVKNYLNQGKKVLFSGTPCQCDGLRGYLKKDYENLLIIDIICHGVPNQKFFNSYIDYKFPHLNNIKDFKFRDKSKGWEKTAKITYENGFQLISENSSSFYSLFMGGDIFRKNCYSCKYACQHRVGDLTIGDYWGIQKEHPELMKEKNISTKKGISCIIVNSSKGTEIIQKVNSLFALYESTYEKAANKNGQLKRPSKESKLRHEIMERFRKGGYGDVEQYFYRKYRKKIIISKIFSLLPFAVKDFIRKYK